MLLREADGDRVLPIWISANEMLALALELSSGGGRPSRPLSHDLVETVISRLNARVVRAIITDLQEHIYCAQLLLESASGTLEIDARPSDSIILALKFKAPVFIAEEVAEKRMQLSETAREKPEALWDRLQQIRPEDFNTLSM